MRSILIFLLIGCGALGAEPKFVGVLGTAKDGTFFAVTSSEDGPVKWLTIGDRVEGYVLAEYRPKDDQLVVRKGGREVVLSLKQAKVRAETSLIDEAGIREVARQIVAKWDGWDLAACEIVAWYKTDWNVAAIRMVGDKKETRIIMAPDGFVVTAPK